MNINRNNYEEYFLLYVDNELCAAEKNMVEVFVTENPDLQEELMMLQQSVIKPEEIVFAGKAGLLKPAPANTITTEKLLLLLDKELPAKEQQQLLKLIEKDYLLKEEWLLLQQTVLSTTDTITFKDKASLYRKEEKERRVIVMKWWQMAAAAMLVGFALWGTVSYINNNGQAVNPVETVSNSQQPVKPVTVKDAPAATITENAGSPIENVKGKDAVAVTDAPAENKTGYKKTAPANKINQPGNYTKEDRINTVAQQQRKNDNTPANGLQNINIAGSNIQDIVTVQTQEDRPALINETPDNNSIAKNEYAINTSAGGSDEIGFGDEDEEDRPKKSKLGGFFKRVKRTFERKTKIKTGSGDDVKIANMSFAMH
jgi:hypothetical protein